MTTNSAGGGIDVRWWVGFCRAHLHDYSPAAARFWLTLALIGAWALALAGARLAHLEARELWQILGWTTIAATAAAFPIQIPRSKHSIATGDIVIFLLLALHGTSAAVLAAGLEALIASSRTSSRLSSPVASLCAAAIAMTIGGGLRPELSPQGDDVLLRSSKGVILRYEPRPDLDSTAHGGNRRAVAI